MTTLYRMRDAGGDLLYVGITVAGLRRFSAHRRVKPWWHLVQQIDVEHFATRAEAIAAERDAIKTELPRFNVVHSPAAQPSSEGLRSSCGWCGAVLVDEDAERGFCSRRHETLELHRRSQIGAAA